MPRKKHKAEEIFAKLRQVDVLTAQGRPVAEAVRTIGVTEVTYCSPSAPVSQIYGCDLRRVLVSSL